ncbi:MAG: DNA polymerase III subunit gamma/tau, partial [Rhodospirillaceae bacterium]
TVTPCGVCEHCQAIAADRHIDVLEMDAASRTGVNDIREMIEGVRYRPTHARSKVYIIDEVHMLSNQAFNALLKTLEEPPEHVKFIFATTEIRKVPVTVLSRCQRFDLRRVDMETLARHFGRIAAAEGMTVEPEALRLIVRAADGSVRDGLSLLDQAMARAAVAAPVVGPPSVAGTTGPLAAATVSAADVQDMLGLADRTQVFDLVDTLLQGDARTALALFAGQYEAGADPLLIMQDMLELIHWLTRLKVVPGSTNDPAAPEAERSRGRVMAEKLSMAVLTRMWQMLLKAVGEVRTAPSPLQAAEMALVRFAYAADLPTPAEVVARAGTTASAGNAVSLRPAAPPQGTTPSSPPSPGVPPAGPNSFADVVALCRTKGEMMLSITLTNQFHLVHFEPGRITFRPASDAPRDLAPRLARLLDEWTGQKWVVHVSNEQGAATLTEQEQDAKARLMAEMAGHPLVKVVLETFPGAGIASAHPATGNGPPASALRTAEKTGAAEDEEAAEELYEDPMIEEEDDLS